MPTLWCVIWQVWARRFGMSQGGSSRSLTLGECAFDRSRGLLLRDGILITLRPKAFALLSTLADHAGHVVSKSDLMEAIWPGVFVTEDSLTQSVRELRKALADEAQTIVRTVSKRGYLLSAGKPPAPTPADRPGVAVLRFVNEGAAADAPVVDGFAEDIINALARFRTMPVLARNSSFAYASDATTDWRQVGQAIGATYLVIGKMRLDGERLRVTVSLIDAENRSVLWNEPFSANGQAVFEIQDEVARRVANRLVSRLDDAGLIRSNPNPPESLAAYELVLRGLARFRGYRDGDNLAARDLFKAAVDKEPSYALAHSFLAYLDLYLDGFGEASAEALAGALNRAQHAISLAPEEPRCHRVLGQVLLQNREHEAAEYHFQRALDLNPFDADTIVQLGYLFALRGRPFEAIAMIERAAQINPLHPDWYYQDLASAQYMAGNYADAIKSLSKLPRQAAWLHVRLAAAYAQLGKHELAARDIATVVSSWPDFSIMDFARKGVPYEHSVDAEHFVEGVAKAMDAWEASINAGSSR